MDEDFRFYLSTDGEIDMEGTYCNGVWDKVTDEHVSSRKIIMMINRLYELDKDFVEACLKCNWSDEDYCYGASCNMEDECIHNYFLNNTDGKYGIHKRS